MPEESKQILEKLSEMVQKVLERQETQGQKVSEITVKLDLYRETQQDQNRKIETLEQKVVEVTESTKSVHKRADDLQLSHNNLQQDVKKMNDEKNNDNKWMKRAVLTGVLTIITGVVTAILVAHWK